MSLTLFFTGSLPNQGQYIFGSDVTAILTPDAARGDVHTAALRTEILNYGTVASTASASERSGVWFEPSSSGTS